jgi:cytochrome c oxidase subunit 3
MAHAKHDYHILPPSIWPLLAAAGAFAMLFGAVNWMHGSGPWLFLMGFAAVLYVMYGWWADVVIESQHGRPHAGRPARPQVRLHHVHHVRGDVLRGVVLGFFKHALYPMNTYEASEYVPPEIYAVDAFGLPLINTLILLLSGCAITWAHHALVHNESRKDVEMGLLLGILLGLAFTGLQGFEYYELIAHYDWTFGGDKFFSTFFLATGFHGLHVIIGTIFLFVCYLRVRSGHFTSEKHIGFEAAAWYWHFVDVVWLFLFVAVYIWGQATVL